MIINGFPSDYSNSNIAASFLTSAWVGTSAPYTQSISVAGITEDDNLIIAPIYSTTNATAILQKKAWNLISKVIPGAGVITATCFEEKPTTNITIRILGV